MTSKIIQGHKRPLCPNHSSTFVYGPILMKICMNANIMKTQYMTCYVTFMLWRSFFFTLRPSDLITTLTYVLKDNFCPCFVYTYDLLSYSLLRYDIPRDSQGSNQTSEVWDICIGDQNTFHGFSILAQKSIINNTVYSIREKGKNLSIQNILSYRVIETCFEMLKSLEDEKL